MFILYTESWNSIKPHLHILSQSQINLRQVSDLKKNPKIQVKGQHSLKFLPQNLIH